MHHFQGSIFFHFKKVQWESYTLKSITALNNKKERCFKLKKDIISSSFWFYACRKKKKHYKKELSYPWLFTLSRKFTILAKIYCIILGGLVLNYTPSNYGWMWIYPFRAFCKHIVIWSTLTMTITSMKK